MNDTITINGNVSEQIHELNMEGSWGFAPMGVHKNRMTFYPETLETHPYILWHYCSADEDIDESDELEEIEIGLRITSERQVASYDGVMSFPDLAVALLESLGFDCTEVKDDE